MRSKALSIEPVTAADLAAVVKAYDVRGIFPQQINAQIARAIGAAFAQHSKSAQVLMGRDMRSSGEELAAAFAEGVTAVGVDVIDVGLASTDLIYFASGHLHLPAAMLTASHNPAEYNGIKLCGPAATPIGAESGLAEIAARAAAGSASASSAGSIERLDLLEQFVAHVHSFVNVEALAPLRVVADTANAMGGYVLPPTFADLPFELNVLHATLDGTFPNHPADPLQPENLVDLQKEVLASSADVGLAFDGDADRVFLVDEKARPVSGSLVTALVATGVLERNGPGPILHNLICSRVVPEVIAAAGGKPIRTRVGHSYIKAEMAATGAAFGGEHSGHYYFARNFNADSGLIAALVVLEQISLAAQPLSELLAPLDKYHSSGEINLVVVDPAAVIDRVEEHFVGLADVAGDAGNPATGQQQALELDRLDGLTVQATDWWFNLRPSNTEPLLRLNVEANSAAVLAEKSDYLTGLVNRSC